METLVKLETSKGPHRFKSGKAWDGNSKGRPRAPEIAILREALEKAKIANNKDFIEHFVEKAYTDKDYAVALFRKLVPDKIEAEGFNPILQFITYGEIKSLKE